MSSRQKVRFGPETWAKGDRGLFGAHATDKPFLENMRFYADGSLGVRPRWRDAEIVLPAGDFDANTRIFPAQYDAGFDGSYDDGICAVGTSEIAFYKLDGTKWAEATGLTLLGINRNTTVTRITDILWLVGPVLIRLGQSTPVVGVGAVTVVAYVIPALNAEFGGSIVIEGSTVHGGRAFYWGPRTDGGSIVNLNRVYYSDSAITSGDLAYSTFLEASGAQYFDVDGVVRGCVSVGPNLFIWTQDGKWTMMQGVGEPRTLTFTSLGRARIPGKGAVPAILDRAAVFMSSDLMSMVTMTSGGDIDDSDLGYLGFQAVALPYSEGANPQMVTSSLYNATLVPAPVVESQARHNWNGVWTFEDWDLSTYGNYQVGTSEDTSQEMLAARVIGMATEWHVYFRETTIAGPEYSDAGDFSEFAEDPTGSVTLPRLFDPNRQVRVLKVTLDIRTYSTTGTYFPLPEFTVRVLDGLGNYTTLTIETVNDPYLSRVGSHRVVASGLLPYTSFSDVEIVGIKGVTIEAITVDFEANESKVQ